MKLLPNPSLLSTQVSDLKVVVDSKDISQAPPVQKGVKGEKGDRGETGERGPAGADVSMNKELFGEKDLTNTCSKVIAHSTSIREISF